ncbi:GNAT family N-acetyltransferase [Epilithonimonas hungarica]|uniref:Protein N-acetyltransferase, RimJ/RimL family n=1 Tax=Epilithonimonas hungarica TaxID=454006 RepID=A0A1G7LU09_9FLAO|nr:GNAT family N-acetyltransferase [Epilithonimonas hungarica]MDP9954940.1 RimJ/RimL family protein N-acetyltransferase [Epilithonimonas hungarica]SDF52933.1 Protein N-acetyltransferase, RimJ/RimL family [Epilithonimonas hungarica]
MKLPIITERLMLRKLTPDDLDDMFLLDSNPDVVKYVGIQPLTKKEESLEMIENIIDQYEKNGTARLAVIEKESNRFIGWSGIKLLTEEVNGFKNVYELGYRFLPEFWGKGYATESAKASLHIGFDQLNADKIYAYADVENLVSNYILTKLGFENKGTFLDKGDICNWYELKK